MERIQTEEEQKPGQAESGEQKGLTLETPGVLVPAEPTQQASCYTQRCLGQTPTHSRDVSTQVYSIFLHVGIHREIHMHRIHANTHVCAHKPHEHRATYAQVNIHVHCMHICTSKYTCALYAHGNTLPNTHLCAQNTYIYTCMC